MAEQIPFGTDDFADNPEPRCPCALLLDTSGSMRGDPIRELNLGLKTFQDELAADALARKRVEVSIITFGGEVTVVQPFGSAANFQAPTLTAQGDTPMGAGLDRGLELIAARKAEYRANGIAYYRPWLFLITDGGPTDGWKLAAGRVKQAEESKALAFFSVGVAGADFDTLKQIGSREPLKLTELRFRDLFVWLSASMKGVSRSTPGDAVPLAPPTGWASV